MAQNLLNFPKHGLILEYEKDLPDNVALLKRPGSPSRCYVMAIPDPRSDSFKELMEGAAATVEVRSLRQQNAELATARTTAVDELGVAKLENDDLKGENLGLLDRIEELEFKIDALERLRLEQTDAPATTEPTAEGAASSVDAPAAEGASGEAPAIS